MKKKIIISIIIIALLLPTVLINFTKAETQPFEEFTSLFIKTSEAKPGDKIYVDLYAMFEGNAVVIAVLTNLNRPDKTYEAPINGIKMSDPYFTLDSDAKAGERLELTSIKVSTDSGLITYSTTPGGRNYTNCLGKKYITVVGNEGGATLKNISIKGNTQINKKDKIYLNLETTGKVDFISVLLKNKDIYLGKALVSIQDLKGTPYLDISDIEMGNQYLYEGNCYISDIWLNPDKANYVHYSRNGTDALPLNFDVSFNIVSTNTNSTTDQPNIDQESTTAEVINLNSLKILSEKAKQNDEVGVELSSNKDLNQVMLSFYNEKSEDMMVVYVKGLNTNKPYFIVPYTSEPGTYELNYAILKDENGVETHYRKGPEGSGVKHFDFDSSITIEKADTINTDTLYIENDNLTMDIINQIYEKEENITIVVNADSNPIIDQALFEAIKGADKTIILKYNNIEWIFNGINITEPKTIDISTNIYKSSNEDDVNIDSKLVDTGIVLKFAENGTLPGKCLIRVQSTEDITNTLNKNNTKVYYYNSEEDNFNKVKMQTILTDDNYYEFYINHNSKYVLTKNEIDPMYVSNITTDLELNGETIENTETKEPTSFISNFLNNKTLLKQLAIIFVCVIILILIGKGVILSNKGSKNKKED